MAAKKAQSEHKIEKQVPPSSLKKNVTSGKPKKKVRISDALMKLVEES